jgi:6-phosphogluconolactonase (cycloisomerase 2 family)
MGSGRSCVGCFLLFLVLLAVTGCGSTTVSGAIPPSPTPLPSVPTPTASPAPSPSPGTPTPAPTPTPVVLAPSHFVYGIIDFEADGGIFGGQINPATGLVTPVAGSPTANALGQNIVIQMLADPQGRFLYSLNLGASSFGMQFGQVGIGAYQIDRSSGRLIPAPGQIIFPAVRNGQMAIDGTGRFLYQADGSGVDLYTINQTSGQLFITPFTVPAPAVGNFTAATPDGKLFFNAGNGLVEVYGINQQSGQLSSATTPVPTGGSAGTMTVSADSRFLYVANTAQGTVAVFSVGSSGTLTLMSGSPFPVDLFPAEMSLTPDGRFLYITFQNGPGPDSHVKGYAVNPIAGSFTPIAGAAVTNASSVNVDGSGKFAYVSQTQLSTFRIDPATGALTPVSQAAQPVTDLPTDIVIVP